MSEGNGFKPLPLAELSQASRRAIEQQLSGYNLSLTMEAIGLLRKVQVAYGRGSWPNIDEFLGRVDTPQDVGAVHE